MKPTHRIRRSWTKDCETLKTLNWKQKIRFCMDYYRGYLFVLLVSFLILFYIGDMIYQSRQVIVLQGFFVNDQYDLFPAKKLNQEFSDYLNLPSHQRIAFEDSLYVDLNSSNEYTAASQGKLVAYVAAKELDFVAAPDELARYYAQSFLLADLEELIPADLKEKVKDSFFYAKDGTGVQKACGLDLRGSRFMKDSGHDSMEPYYLIIPSYSSRTDALISFIRYAFE